MNSSGDRSRGSCCSLLVALVLLPIFLWLTLRPDHPSCSIQNFYLPALNRSSNSPTNTTIFMDLRISNGNKEKGVLYDPINVTVRYFQDPNRTLWLGQVPGFYQGHKKKATKTVAMGAFGVNWTDAVARNYSVAFRVDLSTRVRFKIMFWKTKRHRLKVGANVTVNDLGAKNTKKNINLKKSAGEPKNGCCCCCRVGILLVGLAFHLLVL